MEFRMINRTHRIDRTGDQVIDTAHVWIPDPDGKPRLFCLQADILSASSADRCHATVSVLTPGFDWVVIMSLPATEWLNPLPQPTGRENDSEVPLHHFAAGLLSRGTGVLMQARNHGMPESMPPADDAGWRTKDFWDSFLRP